jgi:hypothetical protein
MRTLIILLAAVMSIASCGASRREVALAKTARYRGDPHHLFKGVKMATEDKWRLAYSDETTLTVITIGRWFTPEGTASNWDPGTMQTVGDPAAPGMPGLQGRERIQDFSINVQLTVRLLPEGDYWIVHVEPRYLQFRTGRSNVDILRRDDPSLPGWAHGKADQVAYAIWDILKNYEVQGVRGKLAPPPEPPPYVPPAKKDPLPEQPPLVPENTDTPPPVPEPPVVEPS